MTDQTKGKWNRILGAWKNLTPGARWRIIVGSVILIFGTTMLILRISGYDVATLTIKGGVFAGIAFIIFERNKLKKDAKGVVKMYLEKARRIEIGKIIIAIILGGLVAHAVYTRALTSIPEALAIIAFGLVINIFA